MIDRENVISNLEMNIRWISDHPAHQFPGWGNAVMAMTDALELLKEQEAVEPIMTEQIVFGTNRKCSKCNRELFPAGRYCPHCGRLVKWDD